MLVLVLLLVLVLVLVGGEALTLILRPPHQVAPDRHLANLGLVLRLLWQFVSLFQLLPLPMLLLKKQTTQHKDF